MHLLLCAYPLMELAARCFTHRPNQKKGKVNLCQWHLPLQIFLLVATGVEPVTSYFPPWLRYNRYGFT